jgi:hypothetical protein
MDWMSRTAIWFALAPQLRERLAATLSARKSAGEGAAGAGSRQEARPR